MGRTKKTETAASEAVQEVRDEQEMSQDVREDEGVPAASEGRQEGAVTREEVGPECADELLGCQDVDEAELAEGELCFYVVTGCDALNLREAPSLDAPIVSVLPWGAGVFAGDGPAEDGWRRVFTGRLSGWMLDKHLEALPSVQPEMMSFVFEYD